MARSFKAALKAVEQAANEALAGRPQEDVEALMGQPEAAQAEPDSKVVTVICRFCQESLYEIDKEYLQGVFLNKEKIQADKILPLGRFGKNSSLQIECPYCGEVVFRQKPMGGIDFLTKELGIFPSGNHRIPGLRHGPMHYMVHSSSPPRWR